MKKFVLKIGIFLVVICSAVLFWHYFNWRELHSIVNENNIYSLTSATEDYILFEDDSNLNKVSFDKYILKNVTDSNLLKLLEIKYNINFENGVFSIFVKNGYLNCFINSDESIGGTRGMVIFSYDVNKEDLLKNLKGCMLYVDGKRIVDKKKLTSIIRDINSFQRAVISEKYGVSLNEKSVGLVPSTNSIVISKDNTGIRYYSEDTELFFKSYEGKFLNIVSIPTDFENSRYKLLCRVAIPLNRDQFLIIIPDNTSE